MRFRITCLLAGAVLMAACSSDTTGPKSSLTRDEALSVAASVAGSLEQAPAASMPRVGDMPFAAEPHSFTQDVEVTSPCPFGGTANVQWHMSVTADNTTGAFTLDATGTHAPAGCKVQHDSTTITVDGNPSLTFEAHMAFLNNQPTAPIVVKLNGGFNWSADDGRSGSCSINYQETTDLVAKTRVREGSVCGHTVSETITWT